MSSRRLETRFRFSISRKIALMIIATVVLVAGSIMTVSIIRAENEARARASEEIDRNMRVAWADLKAVGTDYKIEDGKLWAGATALNDLNSLPDTTVSQVGAARRSSWAMFVSRQMSRKRMVRGPLGRR